MSELKLIAGMIMISVSLIMISVSLMIAERTSQILELHVNYAKCYELKKPKTSTSSRASRFSGKHKIVDGKLFCLDDNGSLYPWRSEE